MKIELDYLNERKEIIKGSFELGIVTAGDFFRTQEESMINGNVDTVLFNKKIITKCIVKAPFTISIENLFDKLPHYSFIKLKSAVDDWLSLGEVKKKD